MEDEYDMIEFQFFKSIYCENYKKSKKKSYMDNTILHILIKIFLVLVRVR